MKKTKIVFGIGIVLVVLVAFTAHAAANTVYFEPQYSNASTDNTTWVTAYMDLAEGETLISGQLQIQFDPLHADIIASSTGCGLPAEGKHCWQIFDKNFDFTENGYMWGGVAGAQVAVWDDDEGMWVWEGLTHFDGPMTVRICKYKLEARGSPGVSPLNFGFEMFPEGCSLCQPSKFGNLTGKPLDINWINGTFTHIGPSDTYTKTFTDLGWNLISLPLFNDTDMTVSAIIDTTLIDSYDYLYKYDTTTHSYVEMAGTDEMANGVGYFINITAANAEWEFQGTIYSMMNEGHSDGLNMIGWLNCAKDISTTSLDDPSKTYYIARWDAATQEYETYNPAAPDDFNDFTQMDRGEGYFVSMKTSGTLSESC